MEKSLPEKLVHLRRNVSILYLALHHPRTKWYCKIIPVLFTAYALSPVDLIPDFIPILGFLDDLVIIPLGIWISFKLIPADIIAECRQKAESAVIRKRSVLGLILVIVLWLSGVLLSGWLFVHFFN
jgi:uncharacterized membrane protein YkvA (DUF1232 family)